jgi:uncharacterized protein (DUF427 family)
VVRGGGHRSQGHVDVTVHQLISDFARKDGARVKATIHGKTVAQAADEDVMLIDGDVYFPPDSVIHSALQESSTARSSSWKGDIQYYDVRIDDLDVRDGAWCHPAPPDTAVALVGRDFGGYLAFDQEIVECSEG